MIKLKLDKMIEHKKNALNRAVVIKGIMHKQTLSLSEQLDVLIVKRMSRDLI